MDDPLQITGSQFIGNNAFGQGTCLAETCAGRGGAVAVNDASLTASDTLFQSNAASTDSDEFTRGGAIFATSFATCNLQLFTCKFEGNSASGAGTGDRKSTRLNSSHQ